MKFPEYLNIATPRLSLRPVADDDAAALYQIRSNALVNRYIGRALETNIAQTEAFIGQRIADRTARKAIYWVICKQDLDVPIGTICYWNMEPDRNLAELGYELHPDHQGQGYMREALEAVVKYGFEQMKLSVILALSEVDNVDSIRLLKHCNFVEDQAAHWVNQEASEGCVVYFLTI